MCRAQEGHKDKDKVEDKVEASSGALDIALARRWELVLTLLPNLMKMMIFVHYLALGWLGCPVLA